MTQMGRATHGGSGKRKSGIKWPEFDGSQPCSQVDPEIFFPEDQKEMRSKMPIAKSICASCKYKEPCLEYALAHPELVGIWSGTSDRDRRSLRRQHRRLLVK